MPDPFCLPVICGARSFLAALFCRLANFDFVVAQAVESVCGQELPLYFFCWVQQ